MKHVCLAEQHSIANESMKKSLDSLSHFNHSLCSRETHHQQRTTATVGETELSRIEQVVISSSTMIMMSLLGPRVYLLPLLQLEVGEDSNLITDKCHSLWRSKKKAREYTLTHVVCLPALAATAAEMGQEEVNYRMVGAQLQSSPCFHC